MAIPVGARPTGALFAQTLDERPGLSCDPDDRPVLRTRAASIIHECRLQFGPTIRLGKRVCPDQPRADHQDTKCFQPSVHKKHALLT